MISLIRKLQKLLEAGKEQKITHFKDNCDELVNKYESLLKQIASYMEENQNVLKEFEETGHVLPEHVTQQFHLNTFYLANVRDELNRVSDECEGLLSYGRENMQGNNEDHEMFSLLVGQLKELKQYSHQIETALVEFEEKLICIEEVISYNTLCN